MEKEKARRWWIDWCFGICGVACDWYLAFEWFSGKDSPFSVTVLRASILAIAVCALVSTLATRIVGGKLRESAAVFFLVSGVLLGNLLIWWTVHR
jgi:hypothetical protein